MTNSAEAKRSMLEAAVNAALAGHDLTSFEPVEYVDGRPNGYQARCRRCGQTAWVGPQGLLYSLLSETCSAADEA